MSISLLNVLGDAMWIVAMALIASGSLRFWKRLSPDARVPMQWSVRQTPAWRAARPVAFGLTIGVPFVLGLALSAAAREPLNSPDEVLLILLVRAFVAPLAVLVHYAWMGAAARTLEAEGAIQP